MSSIRRFTAATGLVAPTVALGSILVATVVSPSFTWVEWALSDMGRPSEPTYWLFNGGLVAAGVVGLAFAHALLDGAKNLVHRLGVVAYAIAVVAMVLVGIFHLPKAGHGAAAIAHYFFATVTLWVWGSGDVLAGSVRRGLATIWLGIGHVLLWTVWAGLVAPDWFAGAEFAGAAIFGAWSVVTARRLLVASDGTQ